MESTTNLVKGAVEDVEMKTPRSEEDWIMGGGKEEWIAGRARRTGSCAAARRIVRKQGGAGHWRSKEERIVGDSKEDWIVEEVRRSGSRAETRRSGLLVKRRGADHGRKRGEPQAERGGSLAGARTSGSEDEYEGESKKRRTSLRGAICS